MSRYHDDLDGEAMPYGLWQANLERALKGRRGQQVLRDLRDALLALPQPRLIEGALCTVGPLQRMQDMPDGWGQHAALGAKVEEQGEGVCGVGAYLWHKKVKAGMDPDEAFASLPTLLDDDSDLWDTARLAKQAGIVWTLAWDLAMRNDETLGHCTPEERYEKFLAWIEQELRDREASNAR